MSVIERLAKCHELDFRFEIQSDEKFIFVSHGLGLDKIANIINISSIATVFYLVNLRLPFNLNEVMDNINIFVEQYKILPKTIFKKFLMFNFEELNQFFLNTYDDFILDCDIIGTYETGLPHEELLQIVDGLKDGKTFISQLQSCYIGVHDNHFVYLEIRSLAIIKKLISGTIIYFFQTIYPHQYSELPEQLVNMILTNYHTGSLTCHPTFWDNQRQIDIIEDVDINEFEIRTLIYTPSLSWTQRNIPEELIGRYFWLTYDLKKEIWIMEIN